MKTILTIATMASTLFCYCAAVEAQMDITQFGKGKGSQAAVLDPAGSAPSFFETLNPFQGNFQGNSTLTFDKPISAVGRLHDNTQRVLTQTRDRITKPLQDVKKLRLWPASTPTTDRSFTLVPGWLKPQPAQPEQPTTIAEWLAQPRPE